MTPSDPPITGNYLQFLASLCIHPFSLEIFPEAHLLHGTAEPRLRDANRTAQKKSLVWGNGSHFTNWSCHQEAWVSGKLSLLKSQKCDRCWYFLYKVDETRLISLVQAQLPIFRSVMISSSSSRMRTSMQSCHVFSWYSHSYCSTKVNTNLICFCDCSEATALLH